MALDHLTMDILYNSRTNAIEITGDVKPEQRVNLIEEFIRTQIGQGVDARPANHQEEYRIRIEWYPDRDRFVTSYDTGNKGLRDGILMHVAQNYRLT